MCSFFILFGSLNNNVPCMCVEFGYRKTVHLLRCKTLYFVFYGMAFIPWSHTFTWCLNTLYSLLVHLLNSVTKYSQNDALHFANCFFFFLIRILFLVHSYPLNDAAETVNEIGASIRRVMGGTSGIMYYIHFSLLCYPLTSVLYSMSMLFTM